MVRLILLVALGALVFWIGRRWQATADKPLAPPAEKDITPRDDKSDQP